MCDHMGSTYFSPHAEQVRVAWSCGVAREIFFASAMEMISRNWFTGGCVSLGIGVILGAFGAHSMIL